MCDLVCTAFSVCSLVLLIIPDRLSYNVLQEEVGNLISQAVRAIGFDSWISILLWKKMEGEENFQIATWQSGPYLYNS